MNGASSRGSACLANLPNRRGVTAQFAVPVETYTAPLGKLFVTEEADPPPSEPTGRRILESV